MHTLTIDVAFTIGEKVYLVTDEDQKVRLITAIVLRSGGVLYEVSSGVMQTVHSAVELSAEKNVVDFM